MDSKDSYSIILIGDTGNPHITSEDPVLGLLKKELDSADAVAFLGDLVYPKGIPSRSHPLRKESEKKLTVQLDALKDFNGRIIFLSGNHDWNKGKRDGYEYVLREEKFINQYLEKKDVYLPSGGCPGPVSFYETEYLLIVVINTQWWVQNGFKPIGKAYGCEVENETEFFEKFREVIDKNKNKRILVLGHLPIYSYSVHGGKYLIKHHMFPFTLYKKKAYVPMPLVGSLLPLYRRYFGAKEDIAHPKYARLRKHLKKIFRSHPGLIYAAGHEHNLQYLSKHGNHYIISGSGSKVSYVSPGKHSHYAHAHKGFFKLIFHPDKSVEMLVIETDAYNKDGKLAYKKMIT